MRHRGVRRDHLKHMKRRMSNLWHHIWKLKGGGPRGGMHKWIGVMASTHGKPCSCYMCGNEDRPSLQERRSSVESMDDLASEESMQELRREVDASECSDPNCDCHTD